MMIMNMRLSEATAGIFGRQIFYWQEMTIMRSDGKAGKRNGDGINWGINVSKSMVLVNLFEHIADLW